MPAELKNRSVVGSPVDWLGYVTQTFVNNVYKDNN